ncbi:hypothetical protein K7X08_005948 [Anisodus acutangulus]|uniref:Uncharacterized protein n=1 Tax=Anisodus acutangulus TaxID=402998 RepID=A0A9Q1R8P0_9SOLA|nr:hypothetical protein K7X08_005948 [Anisodus acutangulus]
MGPEAVAPRIPPRNQVLRSSGRGVVRFSKMGPEAEVAPRIRRIGHNVVRHRAEQAGKASSFPELVDKTFPRKDDAMIQRLWRGSATPSSALSNL